MSNRYLLIIWLVALLLAILAGLVWLASRSIVSPDGINQTEAIFPRELNLEQLDLIKELQQPPPPTIVLPVPEQIKKDLVKPPVTGDLTEAQKKKILQDLRAN